jgi:hypothetical protein
MTRRFAILANLDQEARWSGLGVPERVARRISAAAVLLTALAPADADVEIFTPAPVDPARIRLSPAPTMRVGTPPRWDLAWCEPGARAVNDRRFALALAEELGVGLVGSRAVTSLAELDEHLTRAAMSRWVCKASSSAAGRDRAYGEGSAAGGAVRARIARLLARAGAVVIEPWCDRIIDVGSCASVGDATCAPHGLIVDARGGFRGIALDDDALLAGERAELDRVVGVADAALARAGYHGPFAVDAFAYRDAAGNRRFRPLCELNARYTFGHVARALCARYGGRRLGFGEPPRDARVLVAASDDDPVSAWLAA